MLLILLNINNIEKEKKNLKKIYYKIEHNNYANVIKFYAYI